MMIKVCGITQMKQLQQLEQLNMEFAGLNFYKGSPRFVGGKIFGKEIKDADFDMKIVAVFVNQEFDFIMKVVDDYGLEIVQLHGDESPYLCEQLSNTVEVIKAFRIDVDDEQTIDELIADYDDVCDYYLFDTASKMNSKSNGHMAETFGGTGLQFDWTKLKGSKIEKPFFLGGGIGPDDIAKIKAIKHPDFYGVDVNSKFETEPGVKDLAMVMKFKMDLK